MLVTNQWYKNVMGVVIAIILLTGKDASVLVTAV